MSTVTIKAATIDDVPLILTFIKKLAEYENRAHAVTATEEGLREVLFGARQYAEILIAYHENQPAGFAAFSHNFSTYLGKPKLYVEDFFVDVEQRGKGLGKALLAHMSKLALERNCVRVEGAVEEWNAPSIKFYKSIGAEPMNDLIYRLTGAALEKMANE